MNMPTCPKCKTELKSLILYSVEVNRYDASLKEGKMTYSVPDLLDVEHQEYCCPSCKATLSYDEEGAVKLLED